MSDWSSDVCCSDLDAEEVLLLGGQRVIRPHLVTHRLDEGRDTGTQRRAAQRRDRASPRAEALIGFVTSQDVDRSEEHTSELQSLMRISYAVFCLKKKKTITNKINKIVTLRHSNSINNS